MAVELISDPSNPDGPKFKLCSPDGNTVKELTLGDDGHIYIGGNRVTPSRTPYVIEKDTDSTSYERQATFPHPGKTIKGAITKAEIVVCNMPNVTTSDIKIIDKDNSDAVIVEKTGINAQTDTVIDLGAISNDPDDEHIFEVQARKTGGGAGDKVLIRTLLIHH